MAALGVDFGTSHTVAVARWPDGRVRPLLFDGSPLLPSAIFANETDDGDVEGGAGLVVGRDALHSARRAPSQFEPNPKRRIDDGTVLLGDRSVPVPDLLVAVFRRVRTEFVRAAGGEPTEVTVTFPAAWAAPRRQILVDAAAAAGLGRVRLVPEPVAAATYFVRVLRHMVPVGSAVVVYDLGAGTFDGSVVARNAAGFEVLAVNGRDDLGGLDFDELMLTLIGRAVPAELDARWQRLTAPSTLDEARAARTLRDEVREAKERLSRTASVTVMVPLLDVDVPLTRDEFDAAARPLVERTVRVLTEAVRLSKVTPDRIAGVFLVGGASQIPLIATELHRAFGQAPVMIEQPELVVAEGSVLVGQTAARKSGASRQLGSGLAPVSPPALRRPVSPPPVSPVPVPVPPPVQPVLYRPVFQPPPPPQVVFVPQYFMTPPPAPRFRPPWTIRWPARFMTLYGVLFFGLVALALVVLVLPQPDTKTAAEWGELRQESLVFGITSAVLGVLLIHAARWLRRGANGHMWYPMLLCATLGIGGAATGGSSPVAQVICLVLLVSAVFLGLPSARAWVRKPRSPARQQPSAAPVDGEPG